MIKAIVAVGKNWEIGKKNGLLFTLPADMKRFRELTAKSIVVMGENTLLSFPKQKPLKNRVNVVLCPEGHEYENCICIHDFNQLIKFITILAKEYDIFIIGGGMMYKSMLPYCEQVFVTKVFASDPEATVFFPNLDEDRNFWALGNAEAVQDGEYQTKYFTYCRKDSDSLRH